MASARYKWLTFAIASGACAAINGTFAKLTTGPFTSSLATRLSSTFSIPSDHSNIFEYVLRALFFALNLSFDALMWGLFTRALTLASSTVHVSVLNTSTNFLVAATAGWAVFGEKLPGLWWLGAAMLVAGCLMIGSREGRKEEGYAAVPTGEREAEGVLLGDIRGMEGEVDDPLPVREDKRARVRSRSPYLDDSEGER
ncbi:Hypothetical protein D9617_11g009770 [Elsinoe fawcettii]|nr:Hypothetical protein D9617_11g009770 [Elsinoe fawcettii]